MNKKEYINKTEGEPKMKLEEAKKIYGELFTPSIAARVIGVKQPSINDYWERGILTKVKAEIAGVEKSYAIATEVYRYKELREKKNKNE